MSITLHSYFDDYPKIVKKCNAIYDKYGGVYTPERIKEEKGLLLPAYEREDLFREVATGTEDKLVYIIQDPRDTIREKIINLDYRTPYPIAYIGMGSIERPLDHWLADSLKVNRRLNEWLISLFNNRVSPHITIYCSHMSDVEAKALEADLIDQVMRLQSPVDGVKAYKSTRCPVRLFNGKEETSHQTVYSVLGRRQK